MGSVLKDWAHKVWVEPWQELAEEVDAPVQEIFFKPWVALASEAGFVKDEKTLADRKGTASKRICPSHTLLSLVCLCQQIEQFDNLIS
jgi:hypothetical protein